MYKFISKRTSLVFTKVGMKFVNTFLLASILVTNITGVVQASAPLAQPKQIPITKTISGGEKVYEQVEFSRPESRIVEVKGQSESALLNQKQTQLHSAQTIGFELPVTYLSALDPISSVEGWYGQAPLRRDTSVGGGVISINGITYSKGLGAHSYSEYVYDLNKGYTLFSSDIGIDDEVGSAWCNYLASVNFNVYVDGVLQYSSSIMRYHTPAQHINVDVTGASQLKLEITDAGYNGDDPTRCDHADWADAAIKGVYSLPEDAIFSGSSCQCGSGIAINHVGDPINTRTGTLSYPITDLSIPTASGQISFQRTYLSAATALYTTPLGYGWTHNHDMHLVFPSDPGGQLEFLKLKDFSGNLYRFWDMGDGSYIPYSGVPYSLVKHNTTPITYTLKDTNQNTITLNSAGRITSRVDAKNNVINYVYDSNNRLHRINAGAGAQYLELTYNSQGQLVNVADNTGRDVSYTYNGLGDLETSTDVLDHAWTFTYDTTHHLVEVIDSELKVKVHTDYYTSGDWIGRAWRQFDGSGNLAAELIYNSDGSTTITDGLGNDITDTYNSAGVLGNQTDASGGGTDKTFNSNFRPVAITDPEGNTTTLTWSANGTNLTRVKDALQNHTDIIYNALNSPTSVIDPLNYETKYFYEDPSFPTLPTKIEYPLSFDGGVTYTSTRYEYYQPNDPGGQPAGNEKMVTDAMGNKTFYTYTSTGQVTTIVRSYGTSNALTSSYSYDPYGNVVDMTDEAGVINHNEYDAAGRLTKSVQNYVLGRPQNDENLYNLVTEYKYDVRGNQIASINTYGVISRIYYDQADRQTTSVQNLSGQSINTVTPPVRGSGSVAENLRTDTYYDQNGNVIATIDPLGATTRTYYDEAGRPATIVQNLVGQAYSVATPPLYSLAFPDQNIRADFIYDANGNTLATIDTLGVITRMYYDGNNRVVTVVQNLIGQDIGVVTPPGRGSGIQNIRTDTVYDANGNSIATIDPAEVITRIYYDALNRQTSIVQNLTGQAISSSTPPSRISGATDENIRTDTYYDQAGNAIAAVDPIGIVTRTYYDNANRPTSIVKNLTGQSIYTVTPPAVGGFEENIRTNIGYDLNGRRNMTTDVLGHITRYEYNQLGQTIKVTSNYDAGQPQNDLGKFNLVTEYKYDALGRQERTIDTLGRVSLNSYDALGRILTGTRNYLSGQPLNYQNQYNIVTEYLYNRIGNTLSITDARNHTTQTTYDGLYRPVSVIDPNTNINTSVYDGNGNVVQSTNGLQGNTTSFEYDSLNRQVSTFDPLGNETRSLYNSKGNLVLLTDAEGVITRYEYDDLGRLTAVIENYQAGIPADMQTNVRTEYSYDANGNRLGIKNGNGHDTTFTYDDLNRLLTETDPLLHTLTHGYDAAGNLVSMTDANGAATTYIYDEAGRLGVINYPGATADVGFTYNAVGLRATMTDGVGTTSWVYDALNRPISITDPFNKTIGYTYDPVGNRTVLTYPDLHTVSYAYDNGNRLSTVSNQQSQVAAYTYDAADRLTQITRLNNANTAYTYDAASNLLSITNARNSAELLSSFEYSYDNVGNRVQAVEKVNTPVLPVTQTPTFTPTPVNTDTPTNTALPSASETTTSTSTPSATPQDLGLNFGNMALVSYSVKNQFINPVIGILAVTSTSTRTRTPTPTASRTATPTGPTTTPSRTATPTSPTATRTATPTSTATATRTPSATPTGSTSTPSRTVTPTVPTPTRTSTPTNTGTSTRTATATVTPTVPTSTPSRTATPTSPTSTRTSTATKTGTATKTATATPTSPTATRTATPTNTKTATPTRTNTVSPTPSNTATPTLSPTNSSTPSSTPTATAIPNVTQEDFDGPLLGAGWEWYQPVVGPRYSLDWNPGHFQMIVPPAFDHWTDIDTSPQLRRSDMGTGNWNIETSVSLSDINHSNSHEISLMVGFDRYDQVWLDVSSDGTLRVRSVNQGDTTIVSASLPLNLRISKNGTQYTFMYKTPAAGQWTTLGTRTFTAPVSYVGIIPRVFDNSAGTAVFDVDYFRVERFGPVNPPPYTEVEVADFNGPNLEPGWDWYIPKSGPSYSFDNIPGSFQVSLPAYENFEHWVLEDYSPQLRRSGLGDGDWAIETNLGNVSAGAGSIYTLGLEIGFGQQDLLWFGATQNYDLQLQRVGEAATYEIEQDTPVTLRVEKHGQDYTIKYRYDPSEAWTVMAPQTYPGTPLFVGLIARATNTGNSPLVVSWDSFRLERYPSSPSTPTPMPTATPLATNTPSVTPTSTITDTPTITPSPTITETVTPSITPTLHSFLEIVQDTFDGPNLLPGWEWYVPSNGPTISLTAVPGSLRMSLPANRVFEHWGTTDTAPQLRRTDLGNADWAIETRLGAVSAAPNAGYWAALEIGFDQADQIWMGLVDDGNLKAINYEAEPYFETLQSAPITMRVEKEGEYYTFMYKHDSDSSWTVMPSRYYPGTPTYVGLIGRGFNTGSTQMTMDWSYFRLERWPTIPSTITLTPSMTSTPSLTPTITLTPTRTQTPTRTPTNTATVTKTPTVTLTFTPSNTPTVTLTRTPRPTGSATITQTPKPTNTPTATRTPNSTATVIPTNVPGNGVTIINYDYDPLYRLTAADYYYTNEYHHYTYDAVGNRLTQDSMISGQSSSIAYTYDNANRMTSAGGVTYNFDANGNLLSDGANTYTYDSANRLTSVNGTTTYSYNGLNDRLTQNGTQYTLDLNTGLTQVLSDGTNSYTYGLGRVSQTNITTEYFLGDALGSVRQMTNQTGAITFAQSYDPYGVVTQTSGSSHSEYGFTGEQYGDSTQLLFLRARYYNPADGRFLSRDTWGGSSNDPTSFNRWNYTDSNPVNRVDLSGKCWTNRAGPTGEEWGQREDGNNYSACHDNRPPSPYNRVQAVKDAIARLSDLTDYENDCANFVSSILIANGVDIPENGEAYTRIRAGRDDDKIGPSLYEYLSLHYRSAEKHFEDVALYGIRLRGYSGWEDWIRSVMGRMHPGDVVFFDYGNSTIVWDHTGILIKPYAPTTDYSDPGKDSDPSSFEGQECTSQFLKFDHENKNQKPLIADHSGPYSDDTGITANLRSIDDTPNCKIVGVAIIFMSELK